MNARTSRIALGFLASGLLMLAGPAARAETVTYTAPLVGSTEVPPNDSTGSGKVDATYDTTTMKLVWTITYTGLSGAATAAHFHGPAKPDANAGPVVPISGSLASPIKGEATLTAAQAADLAAGLWYFNLHTAKHPPGEIRGQLMKK